VIAIAYIELMDRCLLPPVEREILHRVGTFCLAHATNHHYKP